MNYGDFQCDLTEGFPTCFCIDYEKQTYWIELNFLFDRDENEMNYYQSICDKYGIRKWYDFNDIKSALKNLGEEAYENCWYSIARENDLIEN